MIYYGINVLINWFKKYRPVNKKDKVVDDLKIKAKKTQHIKPKKFNRPNKIKNFRYKAFSRKVLKANKLHRD